MTAAADGNRSAVEPLFETLWPLCVSYARRVLGPDAGLAEDCAQAALVRLFGHLDEFDRARDALTWALTHVTWECRTERRRSMRAAARGAISTEEFAVNGPDLAERRDLVRHALFAIESLGPADAEVILAAIADDGSVRDAMKPATFRKRLERALSRLRAAWRTRHDSI